MSTKRYTVTSALLYANGPIHIGHIAGAYLPADIYVRYLKGKGHDVAFICGSDEHGAAITLQAKKEGISPQKIIDKYHPINKKTFADFGIDFSIYHRTSEKLHHDTAQDFFKTLEEKNVFTKKTTEQFYDEENKQFLADRYISGECPKCGGAGAYGDQCEKCGSTRYCILSSDKLVGEDRNILELRPGITGPASLKYSNEEEILAKQKNPKVYNDEVMYPDKVRINLEYYNNQSIWLDIKIIFATIFRTSY